MTCRHCRAELALTMVDLGSAPPSNAYLTASTLRKPEAWYPLKVLVCESCWLVQTEDHARAVDLFDGEYAYHSSYSTQWLAHARAYAAAMMQRFALTPRSRVVEVASNDGYLLQYFLAAGVPCLGIEPTAGTAAVARSKGIDTLEEFFGAALAERLAAQDRRADLIAANNVLAHVPDINDFVAGFAALLKPQGVATFEFPHLLNLIEHHQFDTVYHEHFSYLSLTVVHRIFAANGLAVFDVESHPTHGGSLRVFAQRAATGAHAVTPRVAQWLRVEADAGVCTAGLYAPLQAHAERIKDDFVSFLIDAKRRGASVAAYGAAAKGNTLMNFAGVRPDLVRCVADRNPAKQGRFMPGSRIPIVPPSALHEHRPDYLVILPWNIADEVRRENAHLAEAGTRFVTAVPRLEIA
jgi:SAM-dependent methyltransferase